MVPRNIINNMIILKCTAAVVPVVLAVVEAALLLVML